MTHKYQPIKDCSHHAAMHFDMTVCWCNDCGQSWKMLFKEDGEPKAWFPLPASEMDRGQRSWDGWG